MTPAEDAGSVPPVGELTSSPLPGWLSLRPEYVGPGIASFTDPPGELRGRVRARFNERGEGSVVMQANDLQTSSRCESLLEFLIGTRHERDGVAGVSFGGRTNPCESLSVRTPFGTYRARGRLLYSLSAKLLSRSGRLTFSPGRSEFEAANSGAPHYWILPLCNFLSHFGDSPNEELRRHPLRLYEGPAPPRTSADGTISQEQWAAMVNERVIAFAYADAPAFLERMPDYRAREARLNKGRSSATVTAVMVGCIGDSPPDFDSVSEWPPYRFLDYLGMATGTPVASPWIELRDEHGRLVSRRHISWGVPAFGRGHAAIREDVHHGIGALLEAVARFRDRQAGGVNVAVRSLVKGGLFAMTIEDKLDHLFRAIDGLCELYKMKEVDVAAVLGGERHAQVKTLLQQTRAEISELASIARAADLADAVALLNRIANAVSSSAGVQAGFGKAVLKLLERFGLPDAEILARHRAVSPRPDRREWPDQLSWYRGLAMHRNYFDVRGGFELDEAVTVMFHLQDILTRIIFKAIGYSGYYQPLVLKMLVPDRTPDWVTASTSIGTLGYGRSA